MRSGVWRRLLAKLSYANRFIRANIIAPNTINPIRAPAALTGFPVVIFINTVITIASAA